MFSLSKKLELVRQTEIFGDISENHQEIVCRRMGIKHIAEGQYLFKEGQSGDELFLIGKGKLQIIRKNTLLATLKEGDLLGEMAVISNSASDNKFQKRVFKRHCAG